MVPRKWLSKLESWRQDRFIKKVGGIGDVLVYNTSRRTENKLVVEYLTELEETILLLARLKDRDPTTSGRLLWSKTFVEIFQRNYDDAS